MNSTLDVILGPMFSGKTTKLIEIIEKLDKENINYIAVKPQIDDRYTENEKWISFNRKYSTEMGWPVITKNGDADPENDKFHPSKFADGKMHLFSEKPGKGE